MKNTKYFSTARPGAKRGGGAAIAYRGNKFNISKVNISIPKPLEVVWGILRPNDIVGGISKIIICSFYSPPASRKKRALVDHIATTMNSLRTAHPKAGIIIAGDKNDLNENDILSICPSLRQMVLKPTRKNKILTIVITDLHRFYQEPIIVAPVPVDQGAVGVPSDHDGVLVIPLNNLSSTSRSKIIKTVRPIKQSALDNLGKEIVLEEWNFLLPEMSPTSLVQLFQDHCSNLIDTHFPLKTVEVSSFDKPWFNQKLKHLRRQRQRAYRKKGKSEKYLQLRDEFDRLALKEVHKYKDKIIAEVTEGKRGSAYKALRKLGTGTFETQQSFFIPSHVDANLSAQQSADILADHFSSISQEFEPIDPSRFTASLREKLYRDNEETPVLEEHYIYRKIKAAKKPNSSVPGDLPKQVVKEFAVELSLPVTVIFNAITRTAEYPRQWVVEYQTPIPKLYPPLSVDDLRNISGTTFFSKLYESCLSDWLMPIVLPYLDPANCGGLKGTSISHYLIRLLHFIHSAADKPQPHAVLLALVDLSKAFNRVDHSLVIEDLHDMHVPAWLLKILISYLTERSMFMKFQGSLSSKRSLPGSSPQGVFLGCFLFMIKFNGALLRPGIPRPIPRPSPIMLSSAKSCTVKYIDDASHACIINLKKDLDRDSAGTGHVLNPVHNTLQEDLDQLKHFTDTNLMIINEKKTNILAFNFSKSIDFTPELRIGDSPYLDVVKDTKLLGIIISDNLKWDLHVEYMCKRAAKKIWMLRRMRLLHIEPHIILDYYLKDIIGPSWNSVLLYGIVGSLPNCRIRWSGFKKIVSV